MPLNSQPTSSPLFTHLAVDPAGGERNELRNQPFVRLVAHFAALILYSGGDSGASDLNLRIGGLLALLAAPGGIIALLLFEKYSSLIARSPGRTASYRCVFGVRAGQVFLNRLLDGCYRRGRRIEMGKDSPGTAGLPESRAAAAAFTGYILGKLRSSRIACVDIRRRRECRVVSPVPARCYVRDRRVTRTCSSSVFT
jgi:hypothetical protein